MRKILFIFVFFAILSVGISGCLNNGDTENQNNTTERPLSDAADNVSNQSNATVITHFNGSVVTVNPLPSGFTHLATRSAVANAQNIGVSDALIGYRNMLTYDNANIYLSVYKCSISRIADDYIQEMIDSHAVKYGNDSKISTVQINGHDAVLIEATVQDTPPEGRYILVWPNWSGDKYDDSYLVVVNGQTNYSVIRELAEASDL